MKSDKISYTFYADIESIIKKIDSCENNLERFSTTNIRKHILCEYLMSTFENLII